MLVDDLHYVLTTYPVSRYESPRHAGHPILEAMGRLRAAHQEHADQLDHDRYVTRASTGIGNNWANVPWLAVMDPAETQSPQRGRYVALFFAADGSALVLAIVWGTQKLRREVGADATSRLRERRASAAGELTSLDGRFVLDEDVDLAAGTPLARDYERSCLAWRQWPAKDLPDATEYWAAFDALTSACDMLIDARR